MSVANHVGCFGAFDDLRAIEAEITKCMSCGNCQAVCPVYKEEKVESLVARGRIQLVAGLLRGELSPTHALKERLDKCTLCQACAASCPTGVNTAKIFLAGRAALVRAQGLGRVKSIIFRGLMNHRGVYRLTVKAGGLFQGIVFARVPGRKGGRFRLPVLFDKNRLLPRLTTRPFLERVPRTVSPDVDRGEGSRQVHDKPRKVAYFVGCGINFMYPEMGEAVVKVLAANGVEVIVPKDQGCCGMPAIGSADVTTARAMARHNLDLFEELVDGEGIQQIITSCSSCGGAWVHHVPEILEGDPDGYGEKARRLAGLVRDISEYLVNETGIDASRLGEVRRQVTYHDPCHLNRSMGVREEPRALLRAIPGVELVEMNKPDRCCGNAGSFSLVHYDLSRRILERKVADIAQTGAECVATGCPGCTMQITDGVYQGGLDNVNVVHPIQLLAEAYDAREAGEAGEVGPALRTGSGGQVGRARPA